MTECLRGRGGSNCLDGVLWKYADVFAFASARVVGLMGDVKVIRHTDGRTVEQILLYAMGVRVAGVMNICRAAKGRKTAFVATMMDNDRRARLILVKNCAVQVVEDLLCLQADVRHRQSRALIRRPMRWRLFDEARVMLAKRMTRTIQYSHDHTGDFWRQLLLPMSSYMSQADTIDSCR